MVLKDGVESWRRNVGDGDNIVCGLMVLGSKTTDHSKFEYQLIELNQKLYTAYYIQKIGLHGFALCYQPGYNLTIH